MRLLCLVLFLYCSTLQGTAIRSYVNEQGGIVFTNLPLNETKKSLKKNYSHVRKLPVHITKQRQFRPLINRISAEQRIDPNLVEAIIEVESAFNPRAVSSKNCKGLMQLHPDTARRFGVLDVFDPEQNIRGGVIYLRWLLDYFDEDLTKTIAAYNAGENAVQKYGGVPPYKETRSYLKKISRLYPLTQNDIRITSRKIHRIKTENGDIVFTNTPWVISSKLE